MNAPTVNRSKNPIAHKSQNDIENDFIFFKLIDLLIFNRSFIDSNNPLFSVTAEDANSDATRFRSSSYDTDSLSSICSLT